MTKQYSMKIGTKKVANYSDVFFIAEAGVNHNGSLELASKLVDAAADAGADAVKFQTFKAEEISTRNAPKSTYHIETTGSDENQSWFDLLKSQELSPDMHEALLKRCQERQILFMSTPYGAYSADLLDELGVAAFKVASTDLNNLPFLNHLSSKGRPIILSTAMSNFHEVTESVELIRSHGIEDLAVLQCSGNYPSSISDANLRVMGEFSTQLRVVSGYSDHTQSSLTAIAATALGAAIIEKHFTLNRDLPGPDHRMSFEPDELGELVSEIKDTSCSLGVSNKFVLESELENRKKLRKSLVTSKRIEAGSVIEEEFLDIKRPGVGIEPKYYGEIVGKRVMKTIEADTVIQWDMITDG